MRLVCVEGARYHLYVGRAFSMSLETEGGATAAEVEWMRLYATPEVFPTIETTEDTE
jgi:hypothetical protein